MCTANGTFALLAMMYTRPAGLLPVSLISFGTAPLSAAAVNQINGWAWAWPAAAAAPHHVGVGVPGAGGVLVPCNAAGIALFQLQVWQLFCCI